MTLNIPRYRVPFLAYRCLCVQSSIGNCIKEIPYAICLNLPDNIYNWCIHYIADRQHKTYYATELSPTAAITASVVQGSALGPVAFIINAADLHPEHEGNKMVK